MHPPTHTINAKLMQVLKSTINLTLSKLMEVYSYLARGQDPLLTIYILKSLRMWGWVIAPFGPIVDPSLDPKISNHLETINW